MASSTSRTGFYTLALCLFPLLNLVNGLQVTPGSECAAYCLDGPNDDPKSPAASTTNSTDIVCLNEEYWSTTKGTKYRTCMECLQSSTSVNGTESDISWYIYNLRYTVDVCLFSFPKADAEKTSTSSPCVLSENCLPLRTALETGSLTPGNGSDYDYCSADNSAFGGSALDDCVQCFRTASNQTYMSNFLTALSAGCEEKPAAGTLLSLSGTLFSSTAVNYTGASSTNQTAAATPSSSDSPLTTGAIIGIAVGAALLLASAVLLFYLYWRRQKRQNLYYFPKHDPHSLGPTRQVKSISSSTIGGGGFIPHYTVDYKRPPGADHQRQQFELYDNNNNSQIKTQHVVIPQRSRDYPETATAGLWGRDTPMQKQHFIPTSQVKTPLANQVNFDDAAAAMSRMGLDEMPTHPAFIPRAFTRGSRNPSAAVSEWQHKQQQQQRPPKTYKPDDFVVQQFLETIDDTSTIDVRSLISPPLPTSNTVNTVKSTTSLLSNNPYANLQAQAQTAQTQTAQSQSTQTQSQNAPSVPPKSPPTYGSGPGIAPNLSLPSFSRVRSPKRYAPPPINIELARPKAQRMPDEAAESGMP